MTDGQSRQGNARRGVRDGRASIVGPRRPRRIAHFDLDTFYVSVERARDPSLIGLPVLVGRLPPRGVVAAASYEAREFGCHSAQPMSQALRACPQAVVVRSDFARYGEVSRLFRAILAEHAPLVEQTSIDEAYADLTGLGDSPQGSVDAAERVRQRVRSELGVAVSVCIAGARVVAKVGSDRAKPDGLIDVPVGGDAAFLAPLPIRELPMVGPRLGEALTRIGVQTIGQIADLDEVWLRQTFGRAGEVLAERAQGRDPAVVRAGRRPNRSMSREVTFGDDIEDRDELARVLARHAEHVGRELRHAERRARTVTLKLRWNDFSTVSRSSTLERAVQSTTAIRDAGLAMLHRVLDESGRRPVRLLGLGVTNLVEDALQLELETAATSTLESEQLDHTLDAVRERFGEQAVRRGLR
jgi:DNA polymerase-4